MHHADLSALTDNVQGKIPLMATFETKVSKSNQKEKRIWNSD